MTPFGLYKFLYMSFGPYNAGLSFQHFIDDTLWGLDFCYAYIEDILVASSSEEEYLDHFVQLFLCLTEYVIIIDPRK